MAQSREELLTEMTELVRQANELLQSPEEGLMSWTMMVAERMDKISVVWSQLGGRYVLSEKPV